MWNEEFVGTNGYISTPAQFVMGVFKINPGRFYGVILSTLPDRWEVPAISSSMGFLLSLPGQFVINFYC
jgi:hypothetical protein